MIRIVLAYKPHMLEAKCALCNDKIIDDPGVYPYLADPFSQICIQCTHAHAPVLATLVELGTAAKFYWCADELAEREYGPLGTHKKEVA